MIGCVAVRAAIQYLCSSVMPNVTSLSVRRVLRTGIVAVALAVVLVPAIKRAQHNWIGVANPTKSIVTPQQTIVQPALGAEPEPPRLVARRADSVEPAPHPVFDRSPDPLRGPPSARS